MTVPFSFEERRNEVFYHNIRVYVSGADVTPYLTSSVSYTYSDRDGISNAKFSLSNAMQVFEMTQDNFKNKFRLVVKDTKKGSPAYSTDGRYSEQAKFEIYSLKQRMNQKYKHEVSTFGQVASGSVGGGTLSDRSTKLNSSQAESTVTYRYPFTVGSLVFHKYDQVRIFEADPHDREGQKWRCVFTGFIEHKPYSTDYVTGVSIVDVSVQDIRSKMSGMRVQANPSAQIGNDNSVFFRGNPSDTIKDSPNAGFFNDLVGGSFSISHVLGNLTWIDSVRFLIFGIDKRVTSEVRTANAQGIGKFQDTTPVKYSPSLPSKSSTLEDWNNTILFGDSKTWLSTAQMIKMGQGTYDEGVFSANNQKVRYLLPSDGAPPSSLISFSMGPQINAKVEWATRLDLLVQVCKAIDYQFYINGLGDMIFEFPMYDFLPNHYGKVYQKIYTFHKGMTKNTINDEGGSPISSLRVESSALNETTRNPAQDANGSFNFPQSLSRTIYSNVLASRIGVHMETHSVPGITDQGRLTQIGLIEFNKRIANYDSFDMDSTYRPYLFLNRPVYNVIKERIGITRTVSYTYSFREDVTLSMNLEYVRKREQDGNFRFVTGGEATPISYSKLYDKVGIEKQGVGTTGGMPDKAKNNDVPEGN